MAVDLPKLVTSAARVAEIAEELTKAGLFVVDLEFASEGRYVPELCLVQVAWPTEQVGGGLALLDAQETELEPIFRVIADTETEVVAHAARQDIALLSTRFEVRAAKFWDTQIAAAFVGVGEQVGYGRLVGELLGVKIDKGPQFTDWTRRPLSDRQLRYAAADVTYLLELWPVLKEKLNAASRLSWVSEESAAMVADVSVRTPANEKYLGIGGWGALRGKSAAALVELATWRETEALRANKPPSWILPDPAMVDVCRRLARNEAALRKAKGVGAGTVRSYAEPVLAAIERGTKNEPPAPPRKGSSLPTEIQPLGALLNVLVGARCAGETLPPKLVGSKSDCEELITWHVGGKTGPLPRMLNGWRRSFIGDDAIALLEGASALRVEAGRIVLRG